MFPLAQNWRLGINMYIISQYCWPQPDDDSESKVSSKLQERLKGLYTHR